MSIEEESKKDLVSESADLIDKLDPEEKLGEDITRLIAISYELSRRDTIIMLK